MTAPEVEVVKILLDQLEKSATYFHKLSKELFQQVIDIKESLAKAKEQINKP